MDGGVGAELILESGMPPYALCFPAFLGLRGPRRSISNSLFMTRSAASFLGVLPNLGTFGKSIMTGGDMSKLSSASNSSTLYFGVAGLESCFVYEEGREDPGTN